MLIDPPGQFDPRGESELKLTTMSIVTSKKDGHIDARVHKSK